MLVGVRSALSIMGTAQTGGLPYIINQERGYYRSDSPRSERGEQDSAGGRKRLWPNDMSGAG